MVITYTSYDEVRAVLGLNDEELTDKTLSLDVFEHGLIDDFYDININFQTLHETISSSANPTPLEARILRLSSLFATYSVARQVSGSLSMLAPKAYADGKASASRFSNDPFKETIKRIQDQYELVRSRLTSALEEYEVSQTSPTTVRSLFSNVAPA